MKPIVLVIGVPCTGKSWMCEQLTGLYTYVHHDLFIGMTGDKYVEAILAAASTGSKPVLAEAPFSVSKIMEPLVAAGADIYPMVLVEDPEVLETRHLARGTPQPPGALARQSTYVLRAMRNGWICGTSTTVLRDLQDLAAPPPS